MTFIKEEFRSIKAFIFDVDGVLSCDTSPINENGDPMRTTNVKDGYAMRNALNCGFVLGIITGGNIEPVRLRHSRIGVEHIYMGTFDKIECLNDFIAKTGIQKNEILYMGDDVPDYPVMLEVGMPVCPSDAIADIKKIAKYISDKKGGEGCVRDVIEQVMRAQNKWENEKSYYWKST